MWSLIECLNGLEEATWVCENGELQDFRSIRRLPFANDWLPLLDQAFHTRTATGVPSVGKKGDHRVLIHPVIGPESTVYAFNIWIAPHSEKPTAPPPTAGNRWLLDRQAVQQTPESFAMSGGGEQFHEFRSAPQFTGRALRSDDFDKILQIIGDPTPGKKILTESTILNARTGRVMPWVVVCRGHDGNEMRILFCDIAQFGVDPKIPTPEALSLRAMSAAAGRYAALAAMATDPVTERRDVILALWVSERPPWFVEFVPDTTDFIHPDDRALFTAASVMRADTQPPEVPIRINSNDGWRTMHGSIRPYSIAGGNARVDDLYIVEFWE